MIIECEVYFVNDNFLIDFNIGDVLNGGNFMGYYIVRIMDVLKLDIVLFVNYLYLIVVLMMDECFFYGLVNLFSLVLGIY